MHYQYIPYIWALIASACMSLSLGIYVLLRHFNSKGAKSFIVSMFVVTIWSVGNALEMSAVDFYTKLFWANIQYFAYCYSPVTLLALCMEFTGYDKFVRNKSILWFAVIPTIIVLLVWTDGLHGLMRYDMHMDYSGAFPVITKKYGPAFYIHAAYSHSLNIFAWILIIKAVFFKNTIYRKQAITLFFGISLIVIPNLLYIWGLNPVQKFDITPVFFGPAGFIITWGIFRFKLFDLVPLARATVIETMDAGVLVLDLQGRIMDINPAFQRIIGMPASKITTRMAGEVFCNIPDLAEACIDRNINYAEFTIKTDMEEKTYEVILSPLTNPKKIHLGRLVVIHDITEKKRVQQELEKQQYKLAVAEERERVARDLHDDLGQVLGFINLQAQGIKKELVNVGVDMVAKRLDKLVEAVQNANGEVREYIRKMRSSRYMESDFAAALKNDIVHFREQSGMSIVLKIPDEFMVGDMETNAQLNTHSIIKEAMNNIAKHSGANNVEISFYVANEELCVSIRDDGKGFDNNNHESLSGSRLGLKIMRERAAEIGGRLEIQTEFGKGSRVVCYIPITKGESKDEINACR